MAVREILRLGNPALYEVCEEVVPGELDHMRSIVVDLHDTMMDFREKYGFGKAIAAPQIGVKKRLVYMHIDEPAVFINPILSSKCGDMMELWDNCMSFPELLVRVKRHRRCRIEYRDIDFKKESMELTDELSELLQHECDHLDGVLAVMRAIDERSFALVTEKSRL